MLVENGRAELGILNLSACTPEQARDFAARVQAARDLGHEVTIEIDSISGYGVNIKGTATLEREPFWRCTGSASWSCDALNNPFESRCSRCEKRRDTFAEGEASKAELELPDEWEIRI